MIFFFFFFFFFFNDTATTEIYTLSLHDALPISSADQQELRPRHRISARQSEPVRVLEPGDRDGLRRFADAPLGQLRDVERRQRVKLAFEPRDKPGDRLVLGGARVIAALDLRRADQGPQEVERQLLIGRRRLMPERIERLL